MKIVKLGPRRGTPKQCHSAGCNHSAGYDMIMLGTDHELFCRTCVEGMSDAYDNALFGWPDEPAHALAVAHRGEAA